MSPVFENGKRSARWSSYPLSRASLKFRVREVLNQGFPGLTLTSEDLGRIAHALEQREARVARAVKKLGVVLDEDRYSGVGPPSG